MIRHTCAHVNMADSNNSDSTSNSSDLEVAGADEIAESNVEPFQGIQPWRFELPGRNTEPRESEEVLVMLALKLPAAATLTARNGKNFSFLSTAFNTFTYLINKHKYI